MEKTQAMRLLEGKGVSYQVVTYPPEERDATAVARHVGVPASRVFKTLVAVRERGKPFLVMVPADRKLDLKKMARAVGEKKVQLASHEEAERLTSLQVGGISALMLINRGFDILLDESARDLESIFISAGQKGINIGVPVEGLVSVTGARFLDVARAR